MAIIFGAIADDDTGATDLAGMLAEQDADRLGDRSSLAGAAQRDGRKLRRDRDCRGVAGDWRGRGVSAHRTAAGLLRDLHPRTIQVKYCSTFDSTTEGNIGPSIDAALDELQQNFTVAVPALPVNGRTTYMGYHFVHQQLLSDSPMRRHPLTPMTNANLVTHLQQQTARKVALAPHPVIREGPESLRRCLRELQSTGIQIAIIDCISDADLATISEVIGELPLISGSSPAMNLPQVWRRSGWNPDSNERTSESIALTHGHGFLVVAGSCSEATRRQNDWLLAQGAYDIALTALHLTEEPGLEKAVASAVIDELHRGGTCLLRTAVSPADVNLVHQWAREQGKTETEVGQTISRRLATVVREIVTRCPPSGLLIAGGETSGTIAGHSGSMVCAWVLTSSRECPCAQPWATSYCRSC